MVIKNQLLYFLTLSQEVGAHPHRLIVSLLFQKVGVSSWLQGLVTVILREFTQRESKGVSIIQF